MSRYKRLLKIIATLILTTCFFTGLKAQTDTEFWFAAPNVEEQHTDRPVGFHFTNPSTTTSSTVTISQPAQSAFTPKTIVIAPSSSAYVDLTDRGGFGLNPTNKTWKNCNQGVFFFAPCEGPITTIDSLENKPANTVNKKGILITATSPITAYYEVTGFNYQGEAKNGDLFALKGSNALGLEFHTPFQNLADNHTWTTATNVEWRSAFDIVATENATIVEITPTQDIIGHAAGITFTVNLNKGETYSAVASSHLAARHPAGSYIKSNKPIAVTVKDDSINGYDLGNGLAGDQIIPTSVFGSKYIVIKGKLHTNPAPGNARDGEEYAFIGAVTNNTQIEIDGIVVATINKGQQYLHAFKTSTAVISTSFPTSVYHLTGIGNEVGGAIIPPITCTGSDTVGFTRSSPAPTYSITVLVPSGGEGNFILNGGTSFLKATDFTTVPNTNGEWKYAQKDFGTAIVDNANLLINTTHLFHLGTINGSEGGDASYGYFSNFDKQPAVITAQPKSPKQMCAGNGTVKFFVSAKGKGTLSYQWREVSGGIATNIANGGVYSGTNTDTLTITNAGPSFNNKTYNVVVTRACSPVGVSSNTVTLIINPIAEFTVQKQDAPTCGGTGKFILKFTNAYKSTSPTGTFDVDLNGDGTYEYPNTTATGDSITLSSIAVGTTVSNWKLKPNATTCTSNTVNSTLTIGQPANPLPPTTTDTSFCRSSIAPALTAKPVTGTVLKWYGFNSTGGTGNTSAPIPPTTTVGTTSYYVLDSNTTTRCVSTRIKKDVTINPLPTLAVATTNPTTCGGNNGSLKLTLPTGATNYSVTYTKGATINGPTTFLTNGSGVATISTSLTQGTISNLIVKDLNNCSVQDNGPYTLTDPAAPTNTTSTSNMCADGVSTRALTGVPSGTWSLAPGSSASIGTISGNTFTVGTVAGAAIIRNSNLNCNTDVSITINTQPTVAIVDPLPVCAPTSVNLTLGSVKSGSTAGLTYTYFTDAAASSPLAFPSAVTTSGTYYVKGTTPSGCSDVKPVAVTINPKPVLSASSPTICSGSTASIPLSSTVAGTTFSYTTASVTGVEGNFNSAGPIIQQSPINLNNTSSIVTYTISGTASGCAADNISASVTVKPEPYITAPNIYNYTTVGFYDQQNYSSGCLHLTAQNVGTNGTAIWRNEKINLDLAFDSIFTVYIGGDDNGADGIAFVMHNDPRGTNAMGTPGQYLGYAGSSGSPTISPSLAVEIDNYYNPGFYSEIPCDHITIVRDGDIFTPSFNLGNTNGLSPSVQASPSSCNVEDGKVHVVRIKWTPNPATGIAKYQIYFDDLTTPRYDIPSVDYNAIFGGVKQVYGGWTGSTGDQTSLQYVCSNKKREICSGNILNEPLVSGISGSTFAWTTTAVSGLSGNTNGSGAAINNTLVNSTLTSQYAQYQVTPSANGCTGPEKIIAAEIKAPVTVTNPNYTICSNQNTNINLSSDQTGTTYTWASSAVAGITGNTAGSGGSISQVLVNSTSSPVNVIYQVTPTYNGCAGALKSITVTVNPQPTVTITNPTAACAPSTVNLTAALVTTGSTAGLTYTYFTDAAATLALASPSAVTSSGTYYIKGATATTCSDIKSVIVTVNPKPVLSISKTDALTCGGTGSASITITASSGNYDIDLNGDGTYEYANQIPAGGVVTLSGLAIGTVIKNVTAKSSTTGCISNADPINTSISAPSAPSNTTSSNAICSDGITTRALTATPAGGIWSLAPGSSASIGTISGSTFTVGSVSGTAIIRYTLAGCSSDVSITINPTPSVIITNSAAVCAPSTVNLTAATVTTGSSAGLTYTYFTDAAAISALASPSAVPTSGTYYIKGATAASCSDIKSVAVTVNPKPVISISKTDAVSCVGTGSADITVNAATGNYDIDLNGDGTYEYTNQAPASGVVNLSGLAIGTVIKNVTIRSVVTGCISNADPINTNISAPLAPSNTTSSNAICSDGTTTKALTATPAGGTWSLASGSTASIGTISGSTFTVGSTSGTAIIRYTLAGCSSDVSITVSPKPTVTITNPEAACSPSSVDLTASAVTSGSAPSLNYTYFTDAAGSSALASPSAVTTSGTYYIKGATAATCSDIKSVVVTVNPKPVISISKTDAATCGSTGSGSITITAAAGNYDIDLNGDGIYEYTNQIPTAGVVTLSGLTIGTVIKDVTVRSVTTGCISDANPVNTSISAPSSPSNTTSSTAICADGVTTRALTASPAGGIWSLAPGSTPSIGTISSSTFTVGNISGDAIIRYTLAGCDVDVTITLQTQPTVLVTNPVDVCSTSNVDITATPVTFGSTAGLSYTYFSNAAGTSTLASPSSITTSGTYYIKGSTAANCSDIKPVLVTVNPKPIFSISKTDAATCGGTGSASISITGATGTYDIDLNGDGTYEYTNQTPAGSMVNLSGLANGTAIKDMTIRSVTTGCISDVNPINTSISAPSVPSNTTSSLPICADGISTRALSADPSGGIWSLAPTSTASIGTISGSTFTVGNVSGTAIVRYTLAGCDADVSIIINAQPTVAITNPAEVCSPSLLDLTAPEVTFGSTGSLTYTYFTDAAASSSLASPSAVNTSETYYIKGTSAATCSDIKPVVLKVNPKPVFSISKTDAASCGGTGSADLTITAAAGNYDIDLNGDGTYEYTNQAPAGGVVSLSGLAIGTVIKDVTVKSVITGCISNADPINTSISAPSAPSNTTSSLPICADGTSTRTLLANPAGGIWSLAPSSTVSIGTISGSTFTVGNVSGTAIIRYTLSGCDVDVSIVINAQPTIAVTNPSAVCDPSTIDLTAPAVTFGSTGSLTYTYFTDAAASSALASPSAVYTSGTYYIKGATEAGCSDIKPVTVLVNPKPIVSITNPSAVCAPNTVDLTGAGVTTGSTGSLTYTYFTDAAASSALASPSAVNSSGTYYIKGATAASCSDIKSVVVTVNPKPTVFITNPAPICEPNTHNLTSATITTGSTAGLSFEYFSNASATVIAATPTAINSSGNYYIVGKTISGCSDTAMVMITINKVPVISVVKSDAISCEGKGSATIDITSAIGNYDIDIDGDNIYDYFNVATNSNAILLPNLSIGQVIKFVSLKSVLTNCVSKTDPIDTRIMAPAAPMNTTNTDPICGNGSTLRKLTGIPAGGIWSLAAGSSASDGAINNSKEEYTSGNLSGNVIIKYTLNNCESDVTIVVNPKPTVSPITPTILCSNGSTKMNLSSDIVSNISWTTMNESGLSGNTAGSGNNIIQKLTNGNNSSVNAFYKVIAIAKNCTSDTVMGQVTIHPLPAVNNVKHDSLCSESITNISLISPVTGSSFNYTTTTVPGVTGNTSGSGNKINQKLINNTNNSEVITYNVVATANNCSGSELQIPVTINPNPVFTGLFSDTICSGNKAIVPLSATVSSTFYTWTTTPVAGVSGNAAGTGIDLIQTLSNSNNTFSTVVYNVTPSANNCVGASSIVTISVYPLSNAGTVTGGDTLCEGNTSGIIKVSGNNGRVIRWETSTSPFTTWNNIITSNNTYQTGQLFENTKIRVTVKSGVCAIASATPIDIIIDKQTNNANAGSDQLFICAPKTTLSANSPTGKSTGVWNIKSGSNGIIENKSLPKTFFSGVDGNSYTLTWTLTNGKCPSTSDDIIIKINQTPSPAVAGIDQLNICSTMANIEATPPAIGTGSWKILNGTGGLISDTMAAKTSLSGLPANSYLIRWKVTASPVCPSTVDETTISFSPTPTGNAGPDQTIKRDRFTTMNATGGVTYSWLSSSSLDKLTIANPIAKPIVTTTYGVNIFNEYGCSIIDSVTIFVLQPINPTNTFTPNGDNENPVWVIQNIKDYPKAEITLFNRWGQVIRKLPGNVEWDGTLQNGAAAEVGTYFYIIDLKDVDYKPYSGSVSILR